MVTNWTEGPAECEKPQEGPRQHVLLGRPLRKEAGALTSLGAL